jgi:acyl-CoA thioester hydrolase
MTVSDDRTGAWSEHRLQVRYGETDQMGVVYHANYLVYFEEGRTRLMEALGLPYAELERRGFGLVVRKAGLRFRSPARYAEHLTVRTRIERVGGASAAFEYEILRAADGTKLAEGSTELACVDLRHEARPVCMLPDELRALMAPR